VGTSPSAVTLLEEDVFRGEHPYNMAGGVGAPVRADTRDFYEISSVYVFFIFFFHNLVLI